MAQTSNVPPPAAVPVTTVNPSSGGSSVSTVPSSSSGSSNSSTTISISNLNDLKAKAPDVYNAMMVGIAQNICSDMEQAQDRLKQIMDEARNNNS